MTKEVNAGAVPVSKYAAKKAAQAKANFEAKEIEVVNGSMEHNVSEEPAIVEGNQVERNRKQFPNPKYGKFQKKPFKSSIEDKPKKFEKAPITPDMFPEHIVAVALLIKNNAEIRRFTALGILNYLLQKGEIKGENRYVSFKWNKFAVKCNGLVREYNYNEPFFLNALVASFTSFSASAQRTINNFCREEMNKNLADTVTEEDVENVVSLNEQYQDQKVNVVED